MCMLILSKPNAVVKKEHIKHSLSWNRHGSGFAYIDPITNKVVIDKGYVDQKKFLDKYEELIDTRINKNAIILHMRFATAGGMYDLDNCHPFKIKGGAMAHNGTFFGRGTMTGPSDSRIVAEQLFDELCEENMKKNFKEIDKAFGYSRVAFLYDTGWYALISEDSGVWDGDVWFSNSGYRGRRS